jgi:hypothetical protein
VWTDSRNERLWNVRPVASLAFGVRRRHDWHPAGNFALNQYRERLLTSSCGLGRYIAADVEQTLTHAGVLSRASLSMSRTDCGVRFGVNSANQGAA